MYWLVPTFPMGVLHGNRDRVEPPGPNLVKSRDPLADPILLILISVLSVTFWTLTYYKMFFFYHVLFDMKLLNYLFCDMFASVLECYELTHISWLSTPGNHAWLNRHCYPIGCVIKSTHQGICSCSPIVNFFKFTFHHGMATSVIFLIKK